MKITKLQLQNLVFILFAFISYSSVADTNWVNHDSTAITVAGNPLCAGKHAVCLEACNEIKKKCKEKGGASFLCKAEHKTCKSVCNKNQKSCK